MPPPPKAAARRRRRREPLPFLEGTRLARFHVQLNQRTVGFRRNVKVLEPAVSPVALATLSRILGAYLDGLTAIWMPTCPHQPIAPITTTTNLDPAVDLKQLPAEKTDTSGLLPTRCREDIPDCSTSTVRCGVNEGDLNSNTHVNVSDSGFALLSPITPYSRLIILGGDI